MDQIDYRLYVLGEQLRNDLSPTRRVAWNAICAESVLKLYSVYFWKKYPIAETFDFVWSYVSNGDPRQIEAAKLHRRLRTLQRSAKKEGYYIEFDVLMHMLQEIWESFGTSAANSAGAAHRTFSVIVHFRNGLDDRDPVLPTSNCFALMERHVRYGRAIFEALRSDPSSDPGHAAQKVEPLDTNYEFHLSWSDLDMSKRGAFPIQVPANEVLRETLAGYVASTGIKPEAKT